MHARFKFAELEEHPLRERLNNEFHARPPIPLSGAVLVSHLAFKHDSDSTEAEGERENLSRLCQASVCNFIERSDTHLMLDAGSFRMRWELHTEFSSYHYSNKFYAFCQSPMQP